MTTKKTKSYSMGYRKNMSVDPQYVMNRCLEFYGYTYEEFISKEKPSIRLSNCKKTTLLLLRQLCGYTCKQMSEMFYLNIKSCMYLIDRSITLRKEDKEYRKEFNTIKNSILIRTRGLRKNITVGA
jgi:hypothetical protein